jgi:hypothetical protein
MRATGRGCVVQGRSVDVAYPCVCCGYRTLAEPPGSHEICPVCGWEDDVHQLRWPYRSGGADKVALIDAQKTLAARVDVADFDREPWWRPIDAGRDRFEPRGGQLAPWPEDCTVLYWWRRRAGTAWWEEVASAVLRFDDGEDAVFVEAVRAVAAVAPPADPDNLSGMEVDFDHYLRRCPSIREVTVRSRPDPVRQLTARCLAEPAASPHRVAAEIEEVWLRDLQYGYWEAHALRVTAASVRLDVATRIDEDGYFIAGAIIVEPGP